MGGLKWAIVLVVCFGSASTHNVTTDEDVDLMLKLNVEAYILSQGYPIETHQVVTSDGYVLTMHRMRHGRVPFSGERPVVFVQHGLGAASHLFFIRVPGRDGFAYTLADGGLDVWYGNGRGTVHSRKHINLDPDHDEEKFEFFDFTWDEIGSIDVPAMIDYILEYTGRDHLHYIGHSQGGTSFLVMNTVKPEYNAKIKTAHLLAGVGYMEHFPNTPLRVAAALTSNLYSLALRFGFVEVPMTMPSITTSSSVPSSGFFVEDVGDMPDVDISIFNTKALCDMTGVTEIQRIYREGITTAELSQMGGGAAIKQFAHYGQNIRTRTFRRWDYGTEQNLEIYGSEDPPIYDLKLITTETTMYYSLGDVLLDERDVLAMAAVMPNTETVRIPREDFSHLAFVTGHDAKEFVFEPIINKILNAEVTYRNSGASVHQMLNFGWILILVQVFKKLF